MNRIRDNVKIAEEDMVQVAKSSGKRLVTFLLYLNIPITEEVVKAAAGNKYSGKKIIALLLN